MNCSVMSEKDERFQWSEVRRGVFNLQVWLSATAYFAILSGLYSFGLFVRLARSLTPLSANFQLPTIINDMKIASNPNQVQLWSVIPYAVATPVTGTMIQRDIRSPRLTVPVFVAFLSDRLKARGLVMLCTL